MKIITPEQLVEILSALPPAPRVVASGNFATPTVLLDATDQALETFTLNMLGAQKGIPDREGITFETSFVGPGMRRNPRLDYVPGRLSLVPAILRNHRQPNVVLLHTSPVMDGHVSLGTEVNVLPAAIETARANGGLVIAQANKHMPYTFGDAEIPLDAIDYLIEVDVPLQTKAVTEPDETSLAISEHIAPQIPDGSTLQLGIGGIPDAVLRGLQQRRHLRIWSEMFSDGVLELLRRGALDADSTITASFSFGSQELYEWLHLNPQVQMMRIEKTNDPGNIAEHPLMMSINTALEVDLRDQVNASYVRGEIYSGFGGSNDFVVGSLHSPGGHSFIALPSWHPKAQVSTVVTELREPVTSMQHSFVATDQGIAACFGKTARQQAQNLINVAHPDTRDELREFSIR